HLGINSLVVMGTHLILIEILKMVFHIVIGKNIDQYITGLVILIIIIMMEIIIIHIFNKYLYATIGKKRLVV
ncbi:MAG: hypothetical protein MUO60_09135, partial [Clostridiaceae bacterium]|nr:hypothetical protein [Clostridiaceae bacterium]